MVHFPGHEENRTQINLREIDKLIKKRNAEALNPPKANPYQTFGASQTMNMDFSKMGALGKFMEPAVNIMNQVYQDVGEPSQREKNINLGRMALNFFTNMSLASTQPGATVLSSGVQAGAKVAQDYLNKSLKDESDKKKLDQAKKVGAVTLASQLKAADDAKTLAQSKIKPKVVTLYKMPGSTKSGAKTMQVVEGSTEYVNLTTNDGGYSVTKPDFGSITENDFGDKVYVGGIYDGQKLTDVQNEEKIDKNENLDSEEEDDDGLIVSTKEPTLIRLTKTQHSQAKDFRKTIMDETKDFRKDIQTGYLKIMQFYDNRDPIGDYSLAVGYAKMIDPGSVAREGEVNAVANSGSIPDTLKAQLLNALTGNGRLPQRVRAGIYNRAIEIFNTERLKALEIINKANKSWSSQVGRDDQLGHILHYTVEPEADVSKKVDLSKLIEEKDFVFNEQALKGMTVQQLRDIIAFQKLTNEQLIIVGNLVKEKLKAK